MGKEIGEQQARYAWGEGFLHQLSGDLKQDFPDMKGFSRRNLEQIRQWVIYWHNQLTLGQQPTIPIALQAVAQLQSIPWGHNLIIISKCKQHQEALYYVQNTLTHGWSRSVLTHQIESGLWQREGKAVSNFAQTLPAAQSDLARQTLKDPYIFDFLSLTKEHTERELELDLIEHITHFLLELGAGFAYIGRQVPLQVGEREFFIDLLLCKAKDKLVAEYTLSDIHKPMGIATYAITHTLPAALQANLPSVEALVSELGAVEWVVDT